MANTSINLNDVVAALNAGTLSMTDLINSIKPKNAYVRAGQSYRKLTQEPGVSQVAGDLAVIYTLGEKVDRHGKAVVPKERKAKNGKK